jgi:hypothetical protein
VFKRDLAFLILAILLFTGAVSAVEDISPRSAASFDERPKIVQLPDGTFMALFVHTSNGVQEVVARISNDNAQTWSPSQSLFKLPQEPGNWGGPEALVDRSGEIHLFFLNDAHTGVIRTGEDQRPKVGQMGQRRLDIWHTKSINSRKSWQAPKRIWEGYTGALNSVVQLKNGRILLPFSYLTNRRWNRRGEGLDSFTFMGQFNCTVAYSDDDGATWRLSTPDLKVQVPDIVSAYGAVEPVVIELKDGRVWMLIRTQLGRFYESFSSDGIKWSYPQPSAIISSDSPAGLVRLTDGRIVLLWNNCQRFPYAHGGRHVLHAAISSDEGKSWRGYREVAQDPYRDQPPPPSGDHGTAYPFPVATKEGKVLFATGQGKGRVLVKWLDPRWLYETRQQSDFSGRGLSDWSTFGTRGVELISAPDNPSRRLLRLRTAASDWPAAAVWNFPAAERGRLRLRLRLERGFGGVNIALTDHFSVPFDAEDQFHNLYNLRVGAGGELPGGAKLEVERWQEIELEWEAGKRECLVKVGGRKVAVLKQQREGTGASYLRMRALAKEEERGGLLVEQVSVEVF